MRRANWTQFQKEHNNMKVQNQNTIKEEHSCLVETILQAVERTVPKTSSETKRRPTVAWWNKKCESEERLLTIETQQTELN